MVKNYLKIAWRNVMKNKLFSFINILSLSVGLVSCMLISMYLYTEYSYDKQHKLGDRLYQIGTSMVREGTEMRAGRTPATMVPAMVQEFPEIEMATRITTTFQDDKTLLQYNSGKEQKSFYETDGFLADPTFFRMFTYDFTEGNPASALNEPNSVVISSDIAGKMFGKESALNKTIHINSSTNGEGDFKVTGVFAPSSTPSHINGRFFMSMQGGGVGQWISGMTDMVNNNMFFSYLLLKPGADPKKLEAKFKAFIDKYAGADLKASGRNRAQYLTKVSDIHLYANDENITPAGSLTYLYILISIAIITLLIACVNFMNLSTARSSRRAVEIGVRKVLGAERPALIRQFLWEATLLAVISFLISLVFTFLLLPLFEQVSGKDFNFSNQQYLSLAAFFLVVTILAGLLAGVYPAFYLSAFKPISVLKGKFSNSLGAISFRKVLVVFQFVISVALIVASVGIDKQMSFLRNKDLGFQKDQQIVIPLRSTAAKAIYPAFKNELLANSSISQAGASIYYPGITNSTDWLLYKQGKTANENKTVYINRVDNTFLQTLGLKALAGRLFSKDFPADTNNCVVLNLHAIKEFGFASPQDAIGKNIVADFGNEPVLFNIVGVANDFHFKDLHSEIESYGFLLNTRQNYNYLIAHAKGGNMKSVLNSVNAAWSKLNPGEPFEYSFLSEDFQKNYKAEEKLASIIRYFTLIAIVISCLGLFGLTTFNVEQRTKEIGIRKVLGASTPELVGLLSKDFLKLVVLSFFIASPIAWYGINKWLDSFAYKAPFSIWIIVIAWSSALLIAFLTISFQAVKAALTNPVKSLRTE